MNSGHRFHVPTLHAFIQAVFHQMGSNELEARLVADHLIASNLAGHDSHGIGMIPSYIRSFSQRTPADQPPCQSGQRCGSGDYA